MRQVSRTGLFGRSPVLKSERPPTLLLVVDVVLRNRSSGQPYMLANLLAVARLSHPRRSIRRK